MSPTDPAFAIDIALRPVPWLAGPDRAAVLAIAREPDIARVLGHLLGSGAAAERAQPSAAEIQAIFAVVHAGRDLVGLTALARIRRDVGRAHLVYAIRAASRRRGLGTRAAALTVLRAESDQALHLLVTCVEASNTASLAILRTLGFRQESASQPDDPAIRPETWRIDFSLDLRRTTA